MVANMCRLFGHFSVKPASAEAELVTDPRSLLRQSVADPKRPQRDGWGVAWFDGPNRPSVVKSARPAVNEPKRLLNAARRARSRVVIGHVRQASNPKGLPGRLKTVADSQPYSAGGLVFAHNGILAIPDEVARYLGARRTRLKGRNDSEVFFWQFMKFMDAYGSIPEALKACVRETLSIWKGRGKKGGAPYTGLNALASDGKSLHALCHYPGAAKETALCDARQPWGVMSLSREKGRVRVSSEDLDAGRWSRFRRSEMVSVERRAGSIRILRERFSPGG